MHGIARLGAAEMGEPGAGDQAMRGIGMVERREHAALREQVGEIEDLGIARRRSQIGERATVARCLPCQLVRGADPGEDLNAAVVIADPADPTLAVPGYELHQTHRPAPPFGIAVAAELRLGAGAPKACPHASHGAKDVAAVVPLPNSTSVLCRPTTPPITTSAGHLTDQTSVDRQISP